MAILGDKYIDINQLRDIVRQVGSYRMVKENRQGSVNNWYIYKGTDSGMCELVKEGTMTECSIFLDNCYKDY